MVVERVNLIDNKLLERREATYLFKGMAGKLTRQEAVKLVAKDLGVRPEKIIPVKLISEFGTVDVRGLFYVYEDVEKARAQLPEYIFLRQLTKEERSKILEERRKAKVQAKLAQG
jgi:small subunit ribosomal protein S24e